MGREVASLDGALIPVDGLVGILLDAAAAHVEFAEGAHEESIGFAGFGDTEPVVVDALEVEGLDLHPELEESVGAGAAGFGGLGEEARGGALVERNADALEVEEGEFDLGIDVARGGGGLDFSDGAFGGRGRCGGGFFGGDGSGGWRGGGSFFREEDEGGDGEEC
jgi:hypothetical protein